ncbi:hypothetical protein CERSUDRAFT_113728 [Gelatoporia subvermispora B]|uniref:Late embryogenesis abundant protein LEA-2 subgroup domain-containing protein n=1 Tax=Ceriporiopsis subvermispora (strain B) TaxID=914234 RepID=M2R207_CERS8|nr:hypothetical protein CERSUDRAFT_113728 [Gelatoporia subvermispora B]
MQNLCTTRTTNRPSRRTTQRSTGQGTTTTPRRPRMRSSFDNDDVVPNRPRGPKTSKNMREWRYEYQGDMWTRGSRARCFGRFFCCTLMIFIFLLISIILSLVLWIKPPDIVINDPSLNETTPLIIPSDDTGFIANFDVDISVNNPNYLSVDFSSIKVDLFYPINNTHIGQGEVDHIDIKANRQTNFTLPFALQYNITDDPSGAILKDLLQKCGIEGSSTGDISVNYKISLDAKILSVPIKPVISNTFSLQCPLTSLNISGLLNEAGINLNDIGSLFDELSSGNLTSGVGDLFSALEGLL